MKTKEEIRKQIKGFYDIEKRRNVEYYQTEPAKYFSLVVELLIDIRDIVANKK